MTIVPDKKDWTWVISTPCDECGFDASVADPSTAPELIRGMMPRWRKVLESGDVAVRPSPGTWSPLEYACHVRDVTGLFLERLALMMADKGVRFGVWDQDQAAIDGAYGESDPAQVMDEIVVKGELMAHALSAVPRSDWSRTALRNNGMVFTLVTFSQYFLHDGFHHLHDVEQPVLQTD